MKNLNFKWFLSLCLIMSLIVKTNAQETVYLTESFEGATFPPTGWTKLNNGEGNEWESTYGPSYVTDGSKSIRYHFNSAKSGDAWMISTAVELQAGAVIEIHFDTRTRNYEEKLKVTMGTAATVAAQTTVLWDEAFLSEAFRHIMITHTVATTGTYYFGWNAHSDPDKFDLYVDNIIIKDQPTCPKPNNLEASNISSNAATLKWTAGSTETNWIVEYGEKDFTLGEGTSMEGVDTDSLIINGLPTNGNYDAYVKAKCAEDDLSSWSDKVSFTTLNNETKILSFSCPDQVGEAVINEDNHTISLDIRYSRDITTLVANFSLSDGATAKIGETMQTSGTTANNFTTPVTYTIVAEDTNITEDWTVTVNQLAALTDNELLSFSLEHQETTPTINTDNHTIAVEMHCVEDVTALKATFSVSPYATVKVGNTVQESGVTTNDFSNPVTYSIIAEDGTTIQNWTVSISNTELTISTFPWIENFENKPSIPSCWKVIDADADGSMFHVAEEWGSSNHTAKVSSHFQASSNDWLITPKIIVNQNNLAIEAKIRGGGSYNTESYNVLISKTGNAIEDFTTILENVTAANDTWANKKYRLLDYNINQGDEIYFAIQYTSASKLSLEVDDIAVVELSDSTQILDFKFPSNIQFGASTIDESTHTININVGYSVDRTNLTPSFSLPNGAILKIGDVEQVSGTTTNDFSNPVTYTVVAEDGMATQEWTVTLNQLPALTDANIESFSYKGTDAVITKASHTVVLDITCADVNNLVTDFALSYGATAKIGDVEQVSGTTANDFSNSVTYTVTAEDGTTTQDWTITVNNTNHVISTFPFTEDFSSGTLGECWKNVSNNSSNQVWSLDNPGSRTLNTTTGSNGFIILDSDHYGSGNSQDADLITSRIDLSSVQDVKVEFEYYYRATNSSASFSYSIDGGNTWTVIKDWGGLPSGNPATFSQDLSEEIGGQSNVKLKWNYKGTYGYYWAIDDIKITPIEKHTVTFNVKEGDDALQNVSISINNKILTTDANGSATIRVPNGDYNYTATLSGYNAVSGSVTVAGADVTEEVGMIALPTITFNVKEGENALQNASISINSQTLTTDASGMATIQIPNGDYDYTVTLDGYNQASGSITVADADMTEDVAMTPFATITFNVKEGENALQNASISINSQTLTTDASGMATIQIPNGDYNYTVTLDGYNQASGSITVADADMTEDVAMTVANYTVTFNVKEGENALQNASISINSQTLTTDASGMATIQVPNGDYDYTVTLDGYNQASGSITVADADVTENVTMTMVAPTNYTVTFNVKEGDNALQNASISINNETLTTDASGMATIQVPNGDYDYTVTLDGYNQASGSVTVADADVTENVAMTMVTTTNYTVTFNVKEGENTLQNASISINEETLTTDANGVATIEVPNGEYEYTVTLDGYNQASGSITVADADVTENVAMTMVTTTNYTVTFNVKEGENALQNASISINNETLTTDASGMATIEVPNGDYDYTVTLDGYNQASGSVTVADADVTENVAMTMVTTTNYTVTFNVKEGDNALQNASISINNETLTTDASGMATIEVPNGDYDYTVTLDGYNQASGSVTVADADVTENVAMTMVTTTNYTVTFNVKDKDGALENASVSINNETLTTDANGMATIELPNGEYEYTVSLADYHSFTSTITVADDNATIDVLLMLSGIEENPFASINIFPNPSNGLVTIEGEGVYEFEVSDLSGRILFRSSKFDTKTTLDLTNYNTGVYLVRLVQNGQVATYKVMKN